MTLKAPAKQGHAGMLREQTQRTPDPVKFHDHLSSSWEQKYGKSSFRTRLRAFDSALQGLKVKGAIWLDAGCGTGTMSRWLAQNGARVRGVDASAEMIHQAERLADGITAEGDLRFSVVPTIERLEFPAGSFDGILCSSVLEYVQDPAASLLEFARVLRPGGALVVSVPNSQSLVRAGLKITHACSRWIGKAWPSWLEHSRHEFSKLEFHQLLRSAGFELRSMEAFGLPGPRWVQTSAEVGPLLIASAVKSISPSLFGGESRFSTGDRTGDSG